MSRAIIIVMDSAGIGELPDADKYGDKGSNTIGNISREFKNLSLPNLGNLGIGNIAPIEGVPQNPTPEGAYGKMSEMSPGKDTTTGHWELMGIVLDNAFPTYPSGFPKDVIEEFEGLIGRKTIANEVASGTEIISRLGDEHVKTGYPIIYTSADSVFQIAAHEDIIPIEELYKMCSIAREMLKGKHAVGRVIARPFKGESGNYVRTTNRKDFSLLPISTTLLDYAKEQGLKVKAVGKIEDIFSGKGITDAVHTKNNMEGVDKTLEYMKENFDGIIFTNLVDFDMVYGHRNNVEGYANALMEFDARVPDIIAAMREDDILVITADHGCDPTTPSTDHSREYIPLLITGKSINKGKNIGVRGSFADLAVTIAEFLNINVQLKGNSFYEEINKKG